MNRFVPTFVALIVVFVLGNSQLGFAQIQILDGDGKQVTPNQIPAEQTIEPAEEQNPQIKPQIFGGNGSRIIIRNSFSSIDGNGELKTGSSGKAIVIGPNGERQEFDLEEGENMELKLGPMRIRGLVPGPAAQEPTAQKPAESFSLGLSLDSVPPAVASQLNLESGLMVSQVFKRTPAADAGVKQYDVLLYADDKQLTDMKDLVQAVNSAGKADAIVSLTLIRGGKEITVAVKPKKGLPMKANPMGGIPQVDLFDFDADGLFAEDPLGKGMEARMRQQMQNAEERFRKLQQQLKDGLIEIPPVRVIPE